MSADGGSLGNATLRDGWSEYEVLTLSWTKRHLPGLSFRAEDSRLKLRRLYPELKQDAELSLAVHYRPFCYLSVLILPISTVLVYKHFEFVRALG